MRKFKAFILPILLLFTMSDSIVVDSETVEETDEPPLYSVIKVENKDELYFNQGWEIPEFEEPTEEVIVEPRISSVQMIEHSSCSLSEFKSYMDYRAITNTSSYQYRLQQQAYTENGIRKYDGRIMIAVAGFAVGTKLDIELTTGEILNTVVGDIKANTNCEHPDGSVIEFIVDSNTMDPDVKLHGSFHHKHPGGVVRFMEIIGG